VKTEACEEVAMKFDAVTDLQSPQKRSKELILKPYREGGSRS